MADNNDWYPPKGHPQDETNRIIFDNLYQLRDGGSAGKSGNNTTSDTGMAVTVALGKDSNNNTVFLIQGKQYRRLTFSGGQLKGIS